MLSNLLHHLSHDRKSISNPKVISVYIYIEPGGFLYKALFGTSRFLYKLGLTKNNTRIHFYEQEEWILILTPLAGSSSVRMKLDNIKKHDLRKGKKNCKQKKLYIMTRDFDSRLRSFYNKKVRNPTNIPKLLLLSKCVPLTHESSPIEFIEWYEGLTAEDCKDKHLYTNEEILASFSNYHNSVIPLSIKTDLKQIESLIDGVIDDVVNSTDEVANFLPPVELPKKVIKNQTYAENAQFEQK